MVLKPASRHSYTDSGCVRDEVLLFPCPGEGRGCSDQLLTLSIENLVQSTPCLARLWASDMLRIAQVSVAFPDISKRSVHNSSLSVVEREGRVLRLSVTGDRLASLLPRATLGILTSTTEPWSAALLSQSAPSPMLREATDEIVQETHRKSLGALAVRKVFRSSTGLIHTVTCKTRGSDAYGVVLLLPAVTGKCQFCKILETLAGAVGATPEPGTISALLSASAASV